jgi:hypothetical protein
MTSLDVDDPLLASVLLLDGPGRTEGTLRVVAHLRDGRRFSLDVVTLAELGQRLAGAPALALDPLLLVPALSAEAALAAVRAAVAQGVERFGTLDPPLTE